MSGEFNPNSNLSANSPLPPNALGTSAQNNPGEHIQPVQTQAPQQAPQQPNLQNIFDPNATNGLMQMAQKMAENMEKKMGPGAGPENMNFEGMIDEMIPAMTSMFGNTDPIMQEQVKRMTKTAFKTMVGQDDSERGPVANSKINLPGSGPANPGTSSEKGFKQPKSEQKYEELDDDEDVDVFRPRTKDIEISLGVTLEEFFNGHEKKLAINRKRIKKEGKKQVVVDEKRKIVIPIEPGMRDEQVIRYNKQADEIPGYETGDIVISLRENGHNYFEREGDNLFVVKNISLFESFAAAAGIINLTVRNLNRVYLKLDADGVPLHSGDGLRKIEGQGMPLYKKSGFGDLYIRFNLVLPEKMDPERIQDLKFMFPPIEKDIIYNDGSKGGLYVSSSDELRDCVLKEVTEEDLEELDYEEYSDSESEYSGQSGQSEEESEEESESEEDQKKKRYGKKR
jgi:DnaJ-class molecular chaperone